LRGTKQTKLISEANRKAKPSVNEVNTFRQGGKNGKEEESHYKHNKETCETETDTKKEEKDDGNRKKQN
jgi:hypothetical protein